MAIPPSPVFSISSYLPAISLLFIDILLGIRGLYGYAVAALLVDADVEGFTLLSYPNNNEYNLIGENNEMLPYELTAAQKRCVSEIAADMKKDVPMRRMLIGDVGSGKTIVAASAMLIAVMSGRQAALMAPTEILARQHYEDLSELFGKLGKIGINQVVQKNVTNVKSEKYMKNILKVKGNILKANQLQVLKNLTNIVDGLSGAKEQPMFQLLRIFHFI